MHIVVIDAIDECVEYRYKTNGILNLISHRLWKLPVWLKWILFSRDIPFELHHEHLILRRKLLSCDPRNMADIQKYLITFKSKHIVNISAFPTFLLATMLTENTSINSVKIEEIYEHNFHHLFDQGSDYAVAKNIFELMSASLEPISIMTVGNILQHSEGKTGVNDAIVRLKSVVSSNDVQLIFFHQTLHTWLTSNRSRTYQIDIQHGHLLLARHMLGQKTQSIVDLAIHVALSGNITLEKQFIDMDVKNIEHDEFPLHSLVRKHPSPEALRLLYSHFPELHTLDGLYETVAFIAAAQGHVDQLKFLQTNGDVLSFKKEISKRTMGVRDYPGIGEIPTALNHTITLPGYTLVHVAVSNSRFETMKYLLDKLNPSVLQSKSGIGLIPIDLSCLKCDMDIFKKLKNFYLDVDMCAYFAAISNCLNILKLFYHENILFECVSEEKSYNACLVVEKTVMETWTTPAPTIDYYYSQVCSKSTPLHMAVQLNSIETAQFLIEKYPNLLECHNAFGLTAMLLSVNKNRTELFKLMIHRVSIDRCVELSSELLHDLLFDRITYIEYLEMFDMAYQWCLPGWTFNELARTKNRLHMIRFVEQSQYKSLSLTNMELYESWRLNHLWHGFKFQPIPNLNPHSPLMKRPAIF